MTAAKKFKQRVRELQARTGLSYAEALRRERREEELCDAVESWHKAGSGVPLQAWLGMDDEQYRAFVEGRHHDPVKST